MKRSLLSCALMVAIGALALPAGAQTTTSTTSTSLPDTWRMPYQQDFWNYIGATVGRSDYDLGCVAGFDCSTDATGFKIVAGGKLYNILGLEIGYLHLGEADIAGGNARAHGANISLVAGIPVIGNVVGINGKIGGTYGWTKNRVAVPTVCNATPCPVSFESRDDRGFGLSYGAGVTWAFARNLELRVDWDRNRFHFAGVGDENVDLFSAGLNYRF